ncbi:MAG: iron ABC transporter permease [Bacillota bacterium]|nr:iron ABC transporter permease [Bacillota bacterium]
MKCLQRSFTEKNPENSRNKRFLIICVLFLLISLLLSLCIGAVWIRPTELLSFLWDADSMGGRIFWHVRVPRTLAALLAGSALAVAGVILQSILNNPLAGPNIIGINSGAGLGAVLTFAFLPGLPHLVPFTAFMGALATVLLVYGISQKIRASHMTLILTGVAINASFGAAIDAVIMLAPDIIVSNTEFSNGGLTGVTLAGLSPAWIIIILCLATACILYQELNVLNLGEETARSLGMKVSGRRFLFLVLAAALAGCAISIAGLLGFVGLMVPHMIRSVTGNDAAWLLPTSAIAGGGFLVLCDLLSRSLFSPYEIPVGILLAALGGPFFLWLLAGRYRHVSL